MELYTRLLTGFEKDQIGKLIIAEQLTVTDAQLGRAFVEYARRADAELQLEDSALSDEASLAMIGKFLRKPIAERRKE